MKKKKITLIILLLLLLGITIFFLFGRSENKIILLSDGSAEEWDGNQNLPTGEKSEIKTIKIPGFESLAFDAGKKEQKVNFYNPEENDCLFQMTLFVDDEQYWHSGFVEPGKGFYDIILDKTLAPGDYTGSLLIQCYKKDGEELNNARVEFNLKVVE